MNVDKVDVLSIVQVLFVGFKTDDRTVYQETYDRLQALRKHNYKVLSDDEALWRPPSQVREESIPKTFTDEEWIQIIQLPDKDDQAAIIEAYNLGNHTIARSLLYETLNKY